MKLEGDPVAEQFERAYAGTVLAEPSTLDEWPLAEGDIRHRLLAVVVDSVRQARRDRGRVTLPAVKRAIEQHHPQHAAAAFEMLDRGELVHERDLQPIVESLRERGACHRAMAAAQSIAAAARECNWAKVQKEIAAAAGVRADGANRNRIFSMSEAMALAIAPTSKPLARVISFERRLNSIIKITPKSRLVLGASTNVGKTSILARWCRAAMMAGVPACLITVEDPVEALGVKWLAEHATVSATRVRDHELEPHELHRAQEAIDATKGSRLMVVQVEDRTLDGVLAAMRAAAAMGAKLVGIDYIQALRGDRSLKSAKERLDWNLNEIIACGNVCDVAQIIVSQLSRGEKGGPIRPPTLFDLKESGDIENAATWVVLAHRVAESSDAPIVCRVAKVKDGPGIGVRIAWQRNDLGILEDCPVPPKGWKPAKAGPEPDPADEDWGGDDVS